MVLRSPFRMAPIAVGWHAWQSSAARPYEQPPLLFLGFAMITPGWVDGACAPILAPVKYEWRAEIMLFLAGFAA
jgi:hypothetical protein